MNKLTCIFILFCKLSFSQNQDLKGLIEYTYQDSVTIDANIFIPSFDVHDSKMIPTIIIEKKDVVEILLHYVYNSEREKPNLEDTCFIATYMPMEWEGYDPVEAPCYGDTGYCYMGGIGSVGEYTIRFRKGKSVKTYRLVVK
ncbi:MAG TPA: hypothetical protein VGC65_09565 [Bacteroidia bacterium]|jgi:hypothetical protein